MDSNDREYFDSIVEKPDYSQRIDIALANLFDPSKDYWFFKDNLVKEIYIAFLALGEIHQQLTTNN